jgi:23S rRNA (adenine2503-C2)-methyltransferase
MKQEKTNLKGLSLTQLQEFVQSLGEKKYRAKQIFIWLYGKRAQSFEEMTDISKEFRILLENAAAVENLQIATKKRSKHDGTTKFLFQLNDGLKIESVLIPPPKDSPGIDKRLTLCVSTQVGCPLDCKFCATGTMGFLRNLTAGEIVDQVIQAQIQIPLRQSGSARFDESKTRREASPLRQSGSARFDESKTRREASPLRQSGSARFDESKTRREASPRRITNLVFMGMGEPMMNYDNVMKSVELLTDDDSFNFGVRHITISTAGYADRIRQMADEKRKIKLALSLHSLDNEKRMQLMPITKKFGVEELMNAMAYYYRKTRSRPTFEYILFDGFNDTESDIQRLVKVSKRFPCKINLIPFHSIEFTHPSGLGATLRPTPRPRIEQFADALRRADITVMVRSSSGEDIQAACGQLAVEEGGRQNAEIRDRRSEVGHGQHHVSSLISDL